MLTEHGTERYKVAQRRTRGPGRQYHHPLATTHSHGWQTMGAGLAIQPNSAQVGGIGVVGLAAL